MLKKKYHRNKDELITSLNDIDRQTVVLSIEVIETSKIRDYLIYELSLMLEREFLILLLI